MFLLLSNYTTSTASLQTCVSRGVARGAAKLYEDGAIDLSRQNADAFIRTYPVTRRL
jgi:hypothetical protein